MSATSISISFSSSSPSRRRLRKAARVLARALADQGVEHALLGGQLGLGLDLLALFSRVMVDGDLDQVADDLLDIAADVADLGELGGLDLDEGRLGEPGEAARDLGLADAGRADHQDVLGQDLLAQLLGELLAAPAVAQRDGDGALGVVLADDEAVELGDDLARAEGAPIRRLAAAARSAGRLGAVHSAVRCSDSTMIEFIGVDADAGGDGHGLAGDGLGVEVVDRR